MISAKVAALTEGVLKTMMLTKLKAVTATAFLMLGMTGLGAGLVTHGMASARQGGDGVTKASDGAKVPPGEGKLKTTGVDKPDDEAAVATHIKALHAADSETRASAATALRRIVVKYPSGTVYLPSKDGGAGAWQKKVEQVEVDMDKAEVLELLPAFEKSPWSA